MKQIVEWIPIEKSIPGLHEDVLIIFLFDGRKIIDMGYRETEEGEEIEFFCTNCRTWCVPTHWMKLPLPPVE